MSFESLLNRISAGNGTKLKNLQIHKKWKYFDVLECPFCRLFGIRLAIFNGICPQSLQSPCVHEILDSINKFLCGINKWKINILGKSFIKLFLETQYFQSISYYLFLNSLQNIRVYSLKSRSKLLFKLLIFCQMLNWNLIQQDTT